MSFVTLNKSYVQPELHRLAVIHLTANVLSFMPVHSYVGQHEKLCKSAIRLVLNT